MFKFLLRIIFFVKTGNTYFTLKKNKHGIIGVQKSGNFKYTIINR